LLTDRCPVVFLQKEPRVLEKPIVVQSVATNGRLFQFVVFQLNTTDLQSDSGVKNLVWVDEDQPLYKFAKVRPFIKKKVVKVKIRVCSDTCTLSIKTALLLELCSLMQVSVLYGYSFYHVVGNLTCKRGIT